LRRPAGSWRSVAAWAALILIATTVPLTDIALRATVPWLDKLVHGTLYLVLGWLVGAALCATGRRSVGARASALLALSVFALLDEVHQRWLPGRVASLDDWAADVIGATIGLAVGMILWKCAPATEAESASRQGNREEI
jgi:VanZ family protein